MENTASFNNAKETDGTCERCFSSAHLTVTVDTKPFVVSEESTSDDYSDWIPVPRSEQWPRALLTFTIPVERASPQPISAPVAVLGTQLPVDYLMLLAETTRVAPCSSKSRSPSKLPTSASSCTVAADDSNATFSLESICDGIVRLIIYSCFVFFYRQVLQIVKAVFGALI